MHALLLLALAAPLAAGFPPPETYTAVGSSPPLTLSDLLSRARPSLEALAAEVRIAELERALAETASRLREGPTLAVAAGARRTSGSTEPDVALDLDLPLLSGGEARQRLSDLLASASAAWRAEAGALTDARLRSAYLDAWAAERRLALRRDALATAERLLSVTRRRVEAGANPPYETVLAEAERGAAGVALAEAEADRVRAWAELAAVANLPAGAEETSPGLAEFTLEEGALEDGALDDWTLDGAGRSVDPAAARRRFESGALVAGAEARGTSSEALAHLAAARDDSRWSLASALAREADESVARLGVAYRFARSGERSAIARGTEAVVAAARRESEIEQFGLAARFEAALALDRALAAAPAAAPVEPALAALELRLTEGKSPPSEVLLLRRQLLAAREAALDRELARLRAEAEIRLLTAEVKP